MKKRRTIYFIFFLCIIFVAACVTAGRRLDETKLQHIIAGKTTQDEIVQMFGEPSGERINDAETTMWIYQYLYTKTFSFYISSSGKILYIFFDNNEIVTDYKVIEQKN